MTMRKEIYHGERIRHIIYFICIIFTAGCASIPLPKIPVAERIINKPYEVVWNRTVESMPRAGELVVNKDAEKGIIVIERQIQGCQLLFDAQLYDWYYGKILVSIFMDKVSAEATRVLVEVNFVELYDVSRGLEDILGSAEVFREEILFSNLSTEAHYLNYIEKAAHQDKPQKKTFLGSISRAIENLPTKTSWGW
jgi:hypothetical protein